MKHLHTQTVDVRPLDHTPSLETVRQQRPAWMARAVVSTLVFLLIAAVGGPRAAFAVAAKRVQGVVHGASDAPLASATIVFENVLDHRLQTIHTDQRGGFLATTLLPGAYKVTIKAPGYEPMQQRFILSSGMIAGANLSIKLSPQAAPRSDFQSARPSPFQTRNQSSTGGGTAHHVPGDFKVTAANPIGLLTAGTARRSAATSATRQASPQATPGTNAPADFSIYSPVIAPSPLGFGFNVEDNGSGVTDNAWLGNGGGQPYDSRMSFTATDNGSDTTFIANDGTGPGTDFYESILTGYFVGATAYTYRFENNAWELLRTDTVSGYTAVYGSTNTADHTITYATSGPSTQAGDVIWLDLDDVQSLQYGNYIDARDTYFDVYLPWSTETQRGWSIDQNPPQPAPYALDTDIPTATAGGGPIGELSVKLVDTNMELQGLFTYTGPYTCPDSEEFQAGHTYELGVWLKQSGIADGTVTFNLQGMNVNHSFTGVTGSWQYFTYDFTAPGCQAAGSASASDHLDFNAPGTLWENGLQIADKASPAFTLDPKVLQAWTDFKPAALRIWSNFSTNSGGYTFWSLDSWLEPENRTRTSPEIGNYYTDYQNLEHLPASLAYAKQIGAIPWMIVSMSLSAEDWSNLIDYLAAPAGVGYASRRPSDHPGPYTDDFPNMYLEIGNEEWGTQEVPVNFAYGQWAHYVASSAISGKSYFNANQIKFIVNGFFLQPSFGSAAIAQAPEASIVDYALYNGGDQTLTGDAYYQSDLIQLPATNKALIDGMQAQQKADAASGHPYQLAAYESGPGQDTPVHQGDTSLAAATATMDVNLYGSLRGIGPINQFLFSYGTGPYSTHTYFANGFRPHPVWEALQMRNNYLAGDMVWTVGNSVPTSTDGNNYPLIGVYAFRDPANGGNQADIAVISRDLNNTTPVTLHFPGVPTGSANLYTLTGDPRDNNDQALDIPIGSQTLTGITQNYTFNMPPGSIYIFQVPISTAWSTQIPAPATPTSLSATADNSKVELTWASVDGSSSYNVKRGTQTGGPYTTIGTATGPAYIDTAVVNGTTYFYVVTAVNTGGESGVSNEATAEPNVADSALASAPPPLDGSNTGLWVTAPAIPLAHDFNTYTPDTATYKTLWDNTYLYVLASVQDSTLTVSDTPYEGDSVEVYFSGTDSKSNANGPTDFQYVFPYGGGAPVEYHHGATAGVILAQQLIPGGYQLAIAIPWTTLGTTPVAGKQYGFDVMIDDAISNDDRIGKRAWWGTQDLTYANPSLMGPLVLSPNGNLPATTTTLNVSAPDGLISGQPWTLSAVVAPTSGSAIPTGTVTFIAAGPQGEKSTVKLDATGNAVFATTVPHAGAYSVQATYNGSPKFGGSQSSVLPETVVGVPTTTVLNITPTASLVFGQPWTASATVTDQSGAVVTQGQVILTIGAHTQILSLDSTGMVTYSAPNFPAGSYNVKAVYNGTATLASSSSATIPLTIALAQTTTSLTVTPTTGLAGGAPFTLTAVVAPTAGSSIPAGSVTFTVAGPTPKIAKSGLDKTGKAVLTLAAPPQGSYTVTATYSGSAMNAASVSSQVPFSTTGTVPATNVALTQSPASNLIVGQPWNLTAIVTAASGAVTPTGTVTFIWKQGSATATIDPTGKATYTGTVPIIGANVLYAKYSGSPAFRASSSKAISFTVQGPPTTTTLSVTPTGSVTTGQPLTLTARVAPVTGNVIPTGNVTFTLGTINVISALDSTGKATYTTSTLLPGTYALSAAYDGSGTEAASASSSLSETVNAIPTTSTLTVSPKSGALAGQPWTLTATVVQGIGTTVPTGNVNINIGATTVTLPLDTTGKAIYTAPAPAIGAYNVSASYVGTASFAPSTSATKREIVDGTPTTTTFTLAPVGTLTVGQPLTLTATVISTGSTLIPTGNVTFSIGSTKHLVALNSSGVATYVGGSTTTGTISVSATYDGSTISSSSAATAQSVTVVAAGTSIPITVPNYSFEADAVGYTYPANWNFTQVGSAAQYVSNNPIPGITGSNYWAPYDSNSYTAPYGTTSNTITSAAPLGTFAANTGYTLTVALGDPADGVPISDKYIAIELLANGVVVSSFAPKTIVPGAGLSDYYLNFYTSQNPSVVGQNITVALVYTNTGQGFVQAFFDNVRLTQTYGAKQTLVNTTTTLSVNPNSPTLESGQPYTLTAFVAPTGGNAIPTGNVVFNIGGTMQTVALDGTGTATYNGTVPAPASATITAVYQGGPLFGASTSNTLNENFVPVGSPIPIAVPNYSFELDQSGYNYPQDWSFTGTGTDGAYAVQYISNTPLGGTDGNNYWSPIEDDNASAPYGTSTATLVSAASLGTFASNTTYALTVALADPQDYQDFSLKTVSIQILANGVVVGNLTPTNLVPGGNFVDYSVSIDTASLTSIVGQSITVSLVYSDQGQYGGRAVFFDNVRLTRATDVTQP